MNQILIQLYTLHDNILLFWEKQIFKMFIYMLELCMCQAYGLILNLQIKLV